MSVFEPNFQTKKILIASDHAGFELKSELVAFFIDLGLEITDLGCNSAGISVNYPDYANRLAMQLGNEKFKNHFGILICGSGIGVSIAANRHKHIRAALCYDKQLAKLARNHNDANVLCLGARITKFSSASLIAQSFLEAKFEGGRHQSRVETLSR